MSAVRFKTWRATTDIPLDVVRRRLIARCRQDPDGCWRWQKRLTPKGYGATHIWAGGKVESRAHRVSYLAFIGPIPHGMVVMHDCNTNSCINPAHLMAGTHRDNMAHALATGTHCVGSGHRLSKLSAEDVHLIRHFANAGVPRLWLADSFGVTWHTVDRICKHQHRRHDAFPTWLAGVLRAA